MRTNRKRRSAQARRLVAEAAGRRIRDRILALKTPESDALLQAAIEGRRGVAEAADRLLKLIAG